MSDKPEPTILNKHCKVYLRTFRAFRAKNLHPYYCHRRADKEADAQFHLTPEERQKRDGWLDSKLECKGWNKEPEADRGTSLFDDVMHAE